MKLINDNIPKLLKIPDDRIRQCKDNKEFFALLKEVLLEKVNKIFDEKDVNKKIEAYSDIINAITPLANELSRVVGPNEFHEKLADRLQKISGYEQQYVYIEPEKSITEADIKKVEEYGKEHNYPPIEFGCSKSSGGEEAWDNFTAWAKMKEPYSDNFRELLRAVEGK